jgi:endoglucanase
MSAKYLQILKEVVNLPTAPFVEGHVIDYIRRFVVRRPALRLTADRFGNLLVRYRPLRRSARVARPILFAAHMDHPGFIATNMLDAKRVHAEFRGWVQASYFSGERIAFYSRGGWVSARIEAVIPHKPRGRIDRKATDSARTFRDQEPPRAVIARCAAPVEAGSPGMWGMGDAKIRGGLLYARACDDVAGLAAILSMLDEVCRDRSRVKCYAFFTRAEEVGFGGALAAVEARTVPRNAIIVAVECSKAITGVAIGGGPVLRVGDKASVFTPAATAYCQVAAEELSRMDRRFMFQRKLMDGGTCESTAYCHYGYEATGICLPLGNYHNMDVERHGIGPEFIAVDDYLNLVKWFVALAESPATMRYDGRHPGLSKRLDALLRQHRPRLVRTARSAHA